jgi:class 3 adenylate cyclase
VIAAELPTGTATFLFTDVEGSTRLLQELGGEYAAVLEEHRRALREAFARHGGVEVAAAKLLGAAQASYGAVGGGRRTAHLGCER